MAKNQAIAIKLINVRMVYPHLAEPSSSVEGGALKYSACFILEPNSENLASVRAAYDKQLKEAMEGKAPLHKLVRDDVKGVEGQLVISAKNKSPVKCFDLNLDEITDRAAIEKQFYSGCYVTALISVAATTDKARRSIHAYLNGVRFKKDGEPFGGNTVTAESWGVDGDEDEIRKELEAKEDAALNIFQTGDTF